MTTNKKTLLRIIVSTILFLAVVLATSLLELSSVAELILFLFVYTIVGYDIVMEAVGGIGRGQVFDENFLMVLATIGAFATGEYPEAVAVMLLYQIGELFQTYAVGKSRGSISDLMDLRPDTARVISDGVEKECIPEEVEVGQILLVKPGERIPLDGIVVSGCSALDTSALTGESLPRDCVPGDSVLSGSISMSGVLEIRVEKAYYDSTVSKILDMVENASGKKARAERFITRFARYYTPAVVILAILQAVIPPLFDGNWVKWIQNAMNFLVVSCPCALVISVPLSFYCGIGAASRHGILVKGGNYLEQLSKIDTFVFDKTGTLTYGEFRIVQVFPENRKQEIISLAAIAEKGSLHPIAQSILREAEDVSQTGWEVSEIAGHGVIAEKDSEIILVGNLKLMERYHIAVDDIRNEKQGTSLYVAHNGIFMGMITLADTLKKEAPAVIRELKSQGCETIMLTGDRDTVAGSIAKSAGIDQYSADLLPGDKVEKMEQLLSTRDGIVAFVGDGINDSPVLMRADVGIAMGGIGSDAAIEAADVVLMYDSLSALPAARRIAKRTMAIVNQNIVFALAVKLLVLAMTPFGIVSIWLAIFADVGVAVLAILNAMRAGTNQGSEQGR